MGTGHCEEVILFMAARAKHAGDFFALIELHENVSRHGLTMIEQHLRESGKDEHLHCYPVDIARIVSLPRQCRFEFVYTQVQAGCYVNAHIMHVWAYNGCMVLIIENKNWSDPKFGLKKWLQLNDDKYEEERKRGWLVDRLLTVESLCEG